MGLKSLLIRRSPSRLHIRKTNHRQQMARGLRQPQPNKQAQKRNPSLRNKLHVLNVIPQCLITLKSHPLRNGVALYNVYLRIEYIWNKIRLFWTV
jgi:hypothetical protein